MLSAPDISHSSVAVPSGSVDVWLVEADCRADASADALSLAERARFARVLDATVRRQRMATRSALRRVLACYLDTDPLELRLTHDQHGKPSLAGAAGPVFNVSHAGALSVIGVTESHAALGIDIEALRDRRHGSLPVRALSPLELDTLADTPPEQQEVLFLRYWTAKEAYAKATGFGLSIDFRRAVVRQSGDGEEPGASDVNGLPLAHFSAARDLIGAIVVDPGRRLSPSRCRHSPRPLISGR
jgi:phosphopantetheinyl transferase